VVNLLSAYAKDTVVLSEVAIRDFCLRQNIPLRDDHLQFLMRFACQPSGRPEIFRHYGGDFDFETFKSVYSEKKLKHNLR
jgi:hypothetical protein